MKSLFRNVFCLLLLFLGSDALCAQSQQLVVWLKNGEKIHYDLEERPKTTFSDANIVITTNTLETNYPLEQVLRYTYENVSTDIRILPDNQIRISQNNNVLTLENLKSNTSVQLFSIDGKLLETHKASSDAPISISLKAYPLGVYIIKANGVTYKMMKK